MKKIFVFIITLVFTSCNTKEGLELEILDEQLEVFKTDIIEFENSLSRYPINTLNDIEKYKKNVVKIHYKLSNNTNNAYYFNLDNIQPAKNSFLTKFGLAYVKIYDENNKALIVQRSYTSMGSYIEPYRVDLSFLGYYPKVEVNKTIIIYPKEVKYFEWYLVLPEDVGIDIQHYKFNFDYSKNYSLELLLYSNSKNYEKGITRSDLQTIKENSYKVYDGYLVSKNRIPIIFKKPDRSDMQNGR